MKLSEIIEPIRPYVEFGCMVCLEKRNSTLSMERKKSPCALRKIRGEVCDEMERIVRFIESRAVEQMVKVTDKHICNTYKLMLEINSETDALGHQSDAWDYFMQKLRIDNRIVNTGGNDGEG